MSKHFPILVTIREEPFQELSFTNSRDVEGQGGQDRGSQEEEEEEPTADDLCLTFIFIFILAADELRANT